ncbi:MAG: hypothetical protein ACE5PT_02405 [Gemmatimonadales bacterium]
MTSRNCTSRWWVFDDGGVLVARAELPFTFRATEITDEHVLGVERDSLEVEHVRLYDLVRE